MSRRKLKPRVTKKAAETLSVLAQMQELLKQLEAIKEVNRTLTQENAKLQEEVGLILEEHHKEIETLKSDVAIIKRMGVGHATPDFDTDKEAEG